MLRCRGERTLAVFYCFGQAQSVGASGLHQACCCAAPLAVRARWQIGGDTAQVAVADSKGVGGGFLGDHALCELFEQGGGDLDHVGNCDRYWQGDSDRDVSYNL